MERLLKTHFGYDQFRPLQAEIIKTVLAGQDCLVLMPTGGGKSLCFQLPALRLEGLTLVISPLISLMKDQVDALKANGIPAGFINSILTSAEIKRMMEKARQDRIKLLYLAPERLAVPNFRQFLLSLEVSLVAIDEAHCISEWGHDFRPEYRNLKLLRRELPGVPVIALTATATERVRRDIATQLELKKARLFVSSFNRPNLSYHVWPKRNAFSNLVSLLKKHPGEPAIVYCTTRKDTEELAASLSWQGLHAEAYHAGLEDKVRQGAQDRFISDEIPIIVATIAFGMGIDKPDIRLIVHYHVPKTLEGYYQETGRAGRDGLPSECVLFFSYGDKVKLDFFVNQIEDPLERERSAAKLAQVVEFCEWQGCRRAYLLRYFGEAWEEENCGGCDICLSPRELFDATEISQKILSAIIRTGGRFGAGYVIDVLQATGNAKIRQRGHDALSVYGIVKDFSAEELHQLINSLRAGGLIVRKGERYPVLGMTQAGRRWLNMRESIFLPKPASAAQRVEARQSGKIDYDQELYEQLRALRGRLAKERGVPPFVIFGDRSLYEMAAYYPQTMESFSGIFGVGEEKLARFGDDFLKVIKDHAGKRGLAERSIPSRTKPRNQPAGGRSTTCEATRKLAAQKLSLAEMAKVRGLTEQTIIGHLEKLLASGAALDLEHLKPPPDRFATIAEALEETGTQALSPAKARLGKDFSYTELRLVRLFMPIWTERCDKLRT